MKIFPESWQICPANSVCAEIVDCLNKTAPTVEGDTGFRMIRTTNVRHGRVDVEDTRFVEEAVFNKWTRRALPRRGDVILSREAPLGEVGMLRSDAKAFLGQRTMLYRADPKKLDQHYLFYQMVGPYVQAVIQGQGQGSTVAHLRVPDAETLPIPVAPLSTQRKIAAVLAAYDDLIEANRRRIALLERMAEELYREWFVRLRFPGHAQTRRVKGVPVGWTVEPLRAVADESSRSTKPGAHLEGRHYLPLELLGSKQMLPLDHLPHTEAQSSLVTFEQDEFLFGAMRPYQHKVAIAPFPGVTRGTCFVIRPKQTERWAWLFLTLFQPASVDHAMNICNGSDRPYVVWNKGMEKMNVLVPPLELTASFDSVARPILSAITGFYFLQRNLQRTRDLLLPRLISGKLPVEDLAISFPPSMAEG